MSELTDSLISSTIYSITIKAITPKQGIDIIKKVLNDEKQKSYEVGYDEGVVETDSQSDAGYGSDRKEAMNDLD